MEKEYLYVWADGIYPKGGAVDETLALLVVVGVDRQGRKRLLALEEGYRESEESWTDLFRDLKRRGVKWIGLMIGDGIDGLWKAVRKIFPMSRHQRCWVHKMRNILDKVPTKAHDEVLEDLRLLYHAKSYRCRKPVKPCLPISTFRNVIESLFATVRLRTQAARRIRTRSSSETANGASGESEAIH